MRISRNSPFTVYGGVLVTALLLSVLSASSVVDAASLRSPPAGSDAVAVASPGAHRIARQDPYPLDSSEESSVEDDEEAYEAESQHNAYVAQQNQGDSEEDGDEEDDGDEDADDERRRRRRRDTAAEAVTEKEAEPAETTVAPAAALGADTATASPPRNTSVLILIRDALKKVTNDLPTQQVATNALQYFQLFEHFLQQTIEQVIGGDDEDEEEEAAVVAEAPTQPEDAEKPAEAAAETSVAPAEKEPEKVAAETPAGPAQDKPAAPEPSLTPATY